MKQLIFFGVIIMAIVVAGCATQNQQLVGNDKDSHGCIISAGYSWCDAQQKCYRPWEESCAAAAPNQTAASNVTDAHGCVQSQGYTWCEAKQRCLIPTEENCSVITQTQPVPVTPTGNLGIKKDIAISGFAFVPSAVTIPKGATVIWTNDDSATHTVVSDSGNEISSGAIANGETYAHTFNTPGTYAYHCGIHPSMTGTITVE